MPRLPELGLVVKLSVKQIPGLVPANRDSPWLLYDPQIAQQADARRTCRYSPNNYCLHRNENHDDGMELLNNRGHHVEHGDRCSL